jgi:hypothetical protein
MLVSIATDACHPQVNGVVRTLTSLARSATRSGVNIDFLSPDGFPAVPLPSYPELRLAGPGQPQIAQRIDEHRPDETCYRRWADSGGTASLAGELARVCRKE